MALIVVSPNPNSFNTLAANNPALLRRPGLPPCQNNQSQQPLLSTGKAMRLGMLVGTAYGAVVATVLTLLNFKADHPYALKMQENLSKLPSTAKRSLFVMTYASAMLAKGLQGALLAGLGAWLINQAQNKGKTQSPANKKQG
jgi:hypothetical protein